MPKKDPKEFVADTSFAPVDGWEIGTYPGDEEDDFFLALPQVALRHSESGYVCAMGASVPKKTRSAGTPYMKILTGVEDKSEREKAVQQTKEQVVNITAAVQNAVIAKSRQMEQEYDISSLADQTAHYLLETVGVEQKYRNQYEFHHASEIIADGREWLVVPQRIITGDSKEIRYLPTVCDKSGECVTALSPLPDGLSETSLDCTMHGANLEDLPMAVRKKLADLTQEIADKFDVRLRDGVYDKIAGADMLPTTEEVDAGLEAILKTSVKSLTGHIAPYLNTTIIKAGETAWEAAVQRVPVPDSTFALRPVFRNMDTGEAYSFKAADTRKVHSDTYKKDINEVSGILCEQIAPERQEISMQEFCDRVPQSVRAFSSIRFSEIGRTLDMHLSTELSRFLTMPNERETQAALADDKAIQHVLGDWTAKFPPKDNSHTEGERARKEKPPEGPAPGG